MKRTQSHAHLWTHVSSPGSERALLLSGFVLTLEWGLLEWSGAASSPLLTQKPLQPLPLARITCANILTSSYHRCANSKVPSCFFMSGYDVWLQLQKGWLKPFQCAETCLNESCACHRVNTWGERASGSAFVLQSQLFFFLLFGTFAPLSKAMFLAAAGSCYPQMSSGNHQTWFAQN